MRAVNTLAPRPCARLAQQQLGVLPHAQPHSSSRRGVLSGGLLLGLTAMPMQLLTSVQPAQAASALGDFLRGVQKQNGGVKLLAPIKVAAQRLQNAQTLLKAAAVGSTPAAALTSVLQEVRSSSLNCYIFEADDTDSLETKASIFTQQVGISDPCTLR